MQLSKSWLTIQGPQPSTAMEWAWASARIVVVLTAAIGALLFLEGNPARPAIFWAVGFVILYDIAIAVLIKRAYNRAAFRIGFALDHAVLLAVWWVTVQGGNDSAPNDLYLILFPVVIIGAVRVGWALGLAYTLLLIVWMAWADLRYQPANSYPVDQLPIRVAFLVLVAALVGVLVFNLQRARRDAERHGETMAATQRSMAEGLVVIGSDGVVEFYNPAAATIFGIAPHATSDITIHAMSESATRSGQTEGFARSVCALSEQWLDEPTTVYVGNDRPESQHYSLTAFPIVREEARSTGILIRNITEQWELEQRQFGFVSIAAHDLRTPLTADPVRRRGNDVRYAGRAQAGERHLHRGRRHIAQPPGQRRNRRRLAADPRGRRQGEAGAAEPRQQRHQIQPRRRRSCRHRQDGPPTNTACDERG
jgi:PAS domain-containing protein